MKSRTKNNHELKTNTSLQDKILFRNYQNESNLRNRYVNPQKEPFSKRFKKNMELPNSLNLNINKNIESGIFPNTSTVLEKKEDTRNTSTIEEARGMINKVKQNSVSNLLNQRTKQIQQFEQNLNVNRDTSDGNLLKLERKVKKAEGLRNFTHT